jgi:hypothetical protein
MKKGLWEMNNSVGEITRIVCQEMIAQSNLVLDCVEGKIPVLLATEIYPCEAKDIDDLRARIYNIRQRLEKSIGYGTDIRFNI